MLQLFDPLSIPKSDRLQLGAAAFFADDPVALYAFTHRWEGAYHPKNADNVALGSMQMLIGARRGDWYLAYRKRYDALVRTSRDMSDFYHTLKRKEPLEIGRTYALGIEIYGVKADALTLARTYELSLHEGGRLYWGFGISLLRGTWMQSGSATGTARADAPRSYSFDLEADYSYSENYLYRLAVDPSDGYGVALDLGVAWRSPRLGMQVEVLANDLAGRLWWHRAPYSHVLAASHNVSYDAKGHLSYAPTISGIETYRTYLQRLKPRYRLSLFKTFATRWRVGMVAERIWNLTLPRAELSYSFAEDWGCTVSYEGRFRSVGIGVRYRTFGVRIRTDGLSHASAAGLSLFWSHAF